MKMVVAALHNVIRCLRIFCYIMVVVDSLVIFKAQSPSSSSSSCSFSSEMFPSCYKSDIVTATWCCSESKSSVHSLSLSTLQRMSTRGTTTALRLWGDNDNVNDEIDDEEEEEDESTAISSSNVNFILEPHLTDERIEELFAWISCSIGRDDIIDDNIGRRRYDDYSLAIEAIFGHLLMATSEDCDNDTTSAIIQKTNTMLMMKERAMSHNKKHQNNAIRLSKEEREINSLGPLGAGQWSVQYPEKYPHSILTIQQQQQQQQNTTDSDSDNTNAMNNIPTSVEEWIQSLPRTCRQTIRKAQSSLQNQNLTIQTKNILSSSPHATIDHFRCIIEHEIRIATSHLLIDQSNKEEEVVVVVGGGGEETPLIDTYEYFEAFFNAILEAIERYIITIQMCGTILEYRRQEDQKVIAFCHVVGKGRTLRGQWFYVSNQATKHLIWFHSIWYMINYAFEKNNQKLRQQQQEQQQQQQQLDTTHDDKDENENNDNTFITAIDLGPNGSDGRMDAHAILKAKYGFKLYEDWPEIADYRGDFWNIDSDYR